MSGAPRVRSMNVADPQARSVLGSAGNKATFTAARKTASKSLRKPEIKESGPTEERKSSKPADLPPKPAMRRRQEMLLLHSNLSMNASCSSDASIDSFCSRASTGRIGRRSLTSRQRPGIPKLEKIAVQLEKIAQDGIGVPQPEILPGKKRCAWVTMNSDPCYVAFHDEEWGIPIHDDRKLFELLVLSGALAELTWPAILSKRHIFREFFMDFDPILVSKMNEKKIVAPCSTASFLLSEPKLRAILENARQILKVAEEFGSFDKYCWGFVNHKPITSRFRYPRQVPVKTPKADAISKDMLRRGFRSVGPTVIYSFMQSCGMTNDHLFGCYRFEECVVAAAAAAAAAGIPTNPTVETAAAVDEVGTLIDERRIELSAVEMGSTPEMLMDEQFNGQ